ncbi:hypothetical protein [uncultured Bacteroides sp.]|nr:hypothetical protein [uncultured Bacteroides sp.]
MAENPVKGKDYRCLRITGYSLRQLIICLHGSAHSVVKGNDY